MDAKVIPVKVALRSRPLVRKEENEGCKSCVRFVSREQVVVGSDKAFTFDFVYEPTSNQESIYRDVVQPLVRNVFKGYNATVLAYGQTGSGKTYSMGTVYDPEVMEDNDTLGIIPRTVKDIFAGIVDSTNFSISVTFLEIYNEDVVDLLCPKNRSREDIAIREDYTGEIKLTNLQEIKVSSLEETLKCLEQGSLSRTTGATAMNLTSSRSHAIFTIHIEQNDGELNARSKFHLVDLAGSERVKKTRAQGERFKEGININRGLLALGNVISALCEGKSRSHVPYRDSKLTRLLQDSLGGNSHTAMIACISPADSNMEETINTLRYADRARKIKNKPIINQNPHDAEIARLKQLVQQLQMQIIPTTGDKSVPDMETCLQKNRILQNENKKLSKELQNLLNQNAYLNEKVIMAESARDKLKVKLQELSQRTGITMECLSVSLNMSTNQQLKEHFEVIKELHDKVVDIQDEQEQATEEMKIVDKSVLESEDDETSEGDSPRNEFAKIHTIKQAEMNRELQNLNRVLALKEDLMSKMTLNDGEFNLVKQHYEENIKHLEEQISDLVKERDQAINNPSNKISEQRRKRLQELEFEISKLKKKLTEQSKLAKLKEQTDHKVTTLHSEIQNMKQTRVKLVRQMREESDKFRQWKQEKDREVAKLKQQERRRQFELVRMEQTHSKQQGVLRRKMQEVVSANKRLKDALAVRKTIAEKRAENKDQNKQVAWLNHELELMVSSKYADHNLQFLLDDRKRIAQEINSRQKQLEDAEPPKKRVAWESNNDLSSDSSGCETDEIKEQIAALEREKELRSVQIVDLQQKIIDADQDEKASCRWENIHTMIDAKHALKWIFDTAVGAKVENTLKESENNELRNNCEELLKSVEETKLLMKLEIRKLKREHEEEKIRLERQSAANVLFLMRQLPKVKCDETSESVNVSDSEQSMRDRLRFQEEEIANLSGIYEEFEKKVSECDELRRELVTMRCTGEKARLMPQLHDFSGSPIILKTNRLNKSKQHLQLPKLAEIVSEDEEDDEMDNSRDDPDWEATPVKPTVMKEKENEKRKRNSSDVRCKCKGNCTTKLCGCKKNDRCCGPLCLCSSCLNRDENAENLSEQPTKMNSTFNIDTSESSVLKDSNHGKKMDAEDDFVSPKSQVDTGVCAQSSKRRRRTNLFNKNLFMDDSD